MPKKLTTKEMRKRYRARDRRVTLSKATSKSFQRPEGFDIDPEVAKKYGVELESKEETTA